MESSTGGSGRSQVSMKTLRLTSWLRARVRGNGVTRVNGRRMRSPSPRRTGTGCAEEKRKQCSNKRGLTVWNTDYAHRGTTVSSTSTESMPFPEPARTVA